MSFKIKNIIGDHKIYNIDKSKHKFIEYFKSLYNYENLQQINLISNIYENNDNLGDVETDLHKIFYHDLKNNNIFIKLYCDLIKDIFENLFINEDIFIFQSFPSIRIQ